MHVSLNRRSQRVGLSMQYLLWICFGLLAVVPWQVIRGQEAPDQFRVAPLSVDWSEQKLPSKPFAPSKGQRKRQAATNNVPELLSQSSPKSLIFRAQTAPPAPDALGPGPEADEQPRDMSFLGDDSVTGRSGQAYGIQSQASVITGPGIGRKTRILPIQFMPYVFLDNNLFFADVRGFTDLNNGFGMNLGGGYRRYLPRFDRILGFNGFYDYDNTSSALFREMGFGVESLGAMYDIRANAYLPFGNTSQQLSLVNIDGTQKFVGHELQVNQARGIANALHGFDSEIAVPLPGRAALRHDIRVAGGGYWFEGTEISSFGGWKARIQGNVIPSVQLNLQVSNDQQFKTNVVFGATWTFGGYRQEDNVRKTQYSRMTTPVLRSYNIIVGLTTKVDKDVTVVDPTTGNPYFFEHVASYATGSTFNGTVEHPFVNVSDAQAVDKAGDIIFVHANSTYSGVGLVLQDNVRVLGEAAGIEHQVNTAAGLLDLPHPTQLNGAPTGVRPIFDNAPGTGVVLANGSEFSGFQIGELLNPASGAGGVGILGSGLTGNALVRQTDVSWSQLEGVLLNNTSGTITFRGDVINDPVTNSPTVHVTNTVGGPNSIITFTSDPLSNTINPANGSVIATPAFINNVVGNGGNALVVSGTSVGSIVNFTGSTAQDTTGNGISIINNAGIVALGDATVTNGLGIGIDFTNDSGLMVGNGRYIISGSTFDSINIQNLASTGTVIFTDPAQFGRFGQGTVADTNPGSGILISDRNARGINLNNNAGNITFNTPVTIGATKILNAAAIEYQQSSGNVAFTGAANISINPINLLVPNLSGPGIVIGSTTLPIPTTGTFTVNSTTTIRATQSAGGVRGIGIDVTGDQNKVTFNGQVNIEDRGDIGINIVANQAPVTFTSPNGVNIGNNNTVANTTNLPAVNIQGNINPLGIVNFDVLSIEAANGPAPAGFGGIGLNIGGATAANANVAAVTIQTLNIGDLGPVTGGTGLFVDNEGIAVGNNISGLTIGRGTINVTNGSAVDIRNSAMQVNLTTVSSTNATVTGVGALQSTGAGINLLNDRSFLPIANVTQNALKDFMFNVTGRQNVLNSGGTIVGANLAGNTNPDGTDIGGININQTGPLFQTGGVSIAGMNLNRNFDGMVANGLLHMQIEQTQFTSNLHDGLAATNIPSVLIEGSQFTLNGSNNNDNALFLNANTPLTGNGPTGFFYRWNVQNNITAVGFTGGFIGSGFAGPIVEVASPTTLTFTPVGQLIPQNTGLVFNFVHNSVTVPIPLIVANNAPTPIPGLLVNWVGFESGTINNNNFVLTGFGDGIVINNTDLTNPTIYDIRGNTVTGTGGGNIGLDVTTLGPAQLTMAQFVNNLGVLVPNTFTFTTPALAPVGVVGPVTDIAMEFSVLNPGIATASTAASRTLLNFDSNVITMNSLIAGDQAIVFQLLQAPATVTFNNNLISVTTPALLRNEGIDFVGPQGVIALQGTVNNRITVNGANTFPNNVGVLQSDWVNAPNTPARVGQFIVNGFTFR